MDFDFFVRLTENSWSQTLLGWLLGWLSAVLTNRANKKRQQETVKVLSDVIASFGDRIKGSLDPLTAKEQDNLNDATKWIHEQDNPVSTERLYMKVLGMYWLKAIVVGAVGALLSVLIADGFIIVTFAAAFSLLISFIYANEMWPHEASNIEEKRLKDIQKKLVATPMSSKLTQHLRQWVNTSEFRFFSKATILRMIEEAFHAASPGTSALAGAVTSSASGQSDAGESVIG